MNILKIVTVGLISLLSFQSLGNNKGYKITGKTTNAGTVYLGYFIGSELVPIDSVEIKNGTFIFTGAVKSCDQYVLTFEKQKGAFGFFLANEEIDIKVSEQHPYYSRVLKSPLNIEYQIFTDKMAEFIGRDSVVTSEYYNEKDKLKKDSILKVLQEHDKKRTDFAELIFAKNISKPYASVILDQYIKYYCSLNELDSLLSAIPVKARNNRIAQQLKVEVDVRKKSAIGQSFINIEQANPEGEIVSLKEVVAKNKCVMIDFWASWCGPCIKSIPALKLMYSKYHKQGFEIYAVSIDSEKDKWTKCIKDKELPWLHVSELNEWSTQAKIDYAVASVPTTILINKEGIIVARDLHGKELEEKIKECLK